jgi:hypothetical protein
MTKFKLGWRKQNEYHFSFYFGPPYYGYNNLSIHANLWISNTILNI